MHIKMHIIYYTYIFNLLSEKRACEIYVKSTLENTEGAINESKMDNPEKLAT